MKKIFIAIAIASLMAFQVHAQSLPEYTVYGYSGWPLGYSPYGSYDPIHIGGEPFPGASIIMTGASAYATAAHVRCSATGDLRNVTSHSSNTDRWLAAEQVFRNLRTYNSFWRWIAGRPLWEADGFFTVTYADNGTEQWAVINPTFSTVTPGSGMPGTLRVGSGQIDTGGPCG